MNKDYYKTDWQTDRQTDSDIALGALSAGSTEAPRLMTPINGVPACSLTMPISRKVRDRSATASVGTCRLQGAAEKRTPAKTNSERRLEAAHCSA